ncbi:hypothetical protein Stsp02_72040 [Streptomyces sp. NBRC 14336]|nr:hypothetical protein Stsp02_72040 [Streptomyces sp. NBRC 14336]
MVPPVGMATEHIPPVDPTPGLLHDNREVITKANGSGLSGGRGSGADENHPGREDEHPPDLPLPAGTVTEGTTGRTTGRTMTARRARDLQHDLTNAPRAGTLRPRPLTSAKAFAPHPACLVP